MLCYLKSTTDYELLVNIEERSTVKLLLNTDADFANDPIDRKRISGHITMIDGNVISYEQGMNALSTIEAEYVAMNEGFAMAASVV